MTLLPFGFARSASPRKRQGRSSPKAAHKPTFDRLEERCLLAVTYTTPPAFDPVSEMVYGPAGDIWFSRVQDLSITRIASDGTIQEYGVLASVAQPVNLEVDANDNLWFTSASNPPANNLFRLTPAGALTEISDFTSSFNWVNQDPVPPVGFLTNAHVTTTNTLLVGLKADGTVGFYPLPTAAPGILPQYGVWPASVAIDARGDAWYTDNNAIARFTRESEYDYYALPDSNDVAASIAFGGNGNIWFVENSIHVSPALDTYYVADKIGEITPMGAITMFDVKRAGFRLKIGPLVPGTDGSIWFDQVGVEEDGATPEPNTHRIGRINPDGTFSYYIPPNSSAGASALTANAVSPGGNVADSPWFDTVPFAPQSSIVEVHTFSELTPVNAVNHPPVTVNDSASVVSGSTLSVARPGVLGNDTDPDGDALRAILVSGPSHGTLTLNLNGSYTYVPNAGYQGADSFTYQASDGLVQGNTAMTTVTVVPFVDPPTPAALAGYANTMAHSKEHYAQFVTNAYEKYLRREPDAAGLASWVKQMQGGLSDEQLEATLIGSAENVARYGGAGTVWLQYLYRDLLDRTASLGEFNYWLGQLQAGAAPQAVALRFATSAEREGNRVHADYQTFLGRTPSQAEIDGWVNAFSKGLDNESLVGNFLGSVEYYNNPQKGRGNNRDWYQSAMQDELSRAPSAVEVANALAALTPRNLTAAAGQITHALDHYRQFITNAYQQYLGRQPDAAGLSAWVVKMQAGLTDEQLEAAFIGAPEYIAGHGGAGAGWVQGLYHDILGRTPTQAEVNYWVGQLQSGMSAQTVAFGFAASREREGNRVRADYQTFLGRTAAPSEVNFWVNRFAQGLTNEDLVAGFLGSVEYFNAPAKGKSDKADWVVSAVFDELGRSATTAEFSSLEGMLQ